MNQPLAYALIIIMTLILLALVYLIYVSFQTHADHKMRKHLAKKKVKHA